LADNQELAPLLVSDQVWIIIVMVLAVPVSMSLLLLHLMIKRLSLIFRASNVQQAGNDEWYDCRSYYSTCQATLKCFHSLIPLHSSILLTVRKHDLPLLWLEVQIIQYPMQALWKKSLIQTDGINALYD